MSLDIYTGASGHGKTYRLYEELVTEATKHPAKRYLLIVPEQGSLMAQKSIVRMHQNHGVFNIDVLTFGRLAYRIFEELGVELPETLDETGKNLIIRHVMEDVRAQLKIIHPSKRQGLIGDIKSVISEMKQYGIRPEDLQKTIDSMQNDNRLKAKMQDIERIYEGFEAALSGRFVTAEDKPELLLKMIERSDFLRDTIVAFDGFTGFTPVQYRLLTHMLQVCERVIVTATLPNDEKANVIRGEEELFYMSKQMIAKCGELADQCQVPFRVIALETDSEKYRFAKAPDLDFLEKHLLRYDGAKFQGTASAIQIVHMSKNAEEVHYVAADLMKQVRENGMRFRDIAIITGELSLYSKEINRTFTEAGIPFFLDEKRSVLGNPLVELVRGALAAILDNASYQSVFYLLKNALFPVPVREVDCLENYVLSLGIRGWKNYSERFVRKYPSKNVTGYELDSMNKTRERIMELFGPFLTEMTKKKQTVKGYVTAIYQFLENLQVYEQMNGMAEELEAAGRTEQLVRAAEMRKMYGTIMELLDRFYALMGDEEMPLREFADILDAGLGEIKIGVIPPSVDCVTIGDLKRTRLERVKVLYVIGVNEGIIPKGEDHRGVLSEQERIRLEECKLELAPTARKKIYEQNFYLYLNLTESENKLILTYHDANDKGEKARASRLIQMLTKMFGDEIHMNLSTDALSLLSGPGNAIHLATQVKIEQGENDKDISINEGCKRLLTYLWKEEPYHSKLLQMLNAYLTDTREDSLTQLAAKKLYEELEYASVSRAEKYASCAFAHFVSYGLNLEERRIYEISDADMGNIFHRVLELLGGGLMQEGRTFADLQDEERSSLIRTCFDKATVDYGNSIFVDSKANAFIRERLIQILDRTVWALGKQLEAGKFTPKILEKKFAFEFDGMGYYGKIDRVDLYEEDGSVQVKIIDYKSSEHDIKFEDVYAGLQLQLLVYLQDTLRTIEQTNPTKAVIAAAAFYNEINNPYVDVKKEDEDTQMAILDKLRPTGLVNHMSAEALDERESGRSLVAPFSIKKDGEVTIKGNVQTDEHLRELAQYATAKMGQMSREIAAGNIAVNPYKDSCKFCPYASICGFNRPGHAGKYRNKLKVPEEELWMKLREEVALWDGQ